MRSRSTRSGSAGLGLRLAAAAGLLYLHVPMFFILLYAFTTDDKSYQFPPPGLTLKWFAAAWQRQDIWNALFLSVRVALVKLGELATVFPGPGLLAFTAMVVLTILASISFDPRLIWVEPERRP